MMPPEKRCNLYTSSSKYRNWPRLGLGAVGLRSLGLADLGGGLCKRNSVLNVAPQSIRQTEPYASRQVKLWGLTGSVSCDA